MKSQCCAATDNSAEDDRAQMQLLFAELKRIEGQQQQLKTAVAQNKQLVVLPPAGFHAQEEEDEYAEEVVVKPDPDRFVPSGVPAPPAVAHSTQSFATGWRAWQRVVIPTRLNPQLAASRSSRTPKIVSVQ